MKYKIDNKKILLLLKFQSQNTAWDLCHFGKLNEVRPKIFYPTVDAHCPANESAYATNYKSYFEDALQMKRPHLLAQNTLEKIIMK